MPSPANTTITIDGARLNVLSARFDLSNSVTEGDLDTCQGSGGVTFSVELNDQANPPFAIIKKLYDLANQPNPNDIKDVTIELWKDEKRQETLCKLAFKGWLNHFTIESGDSPHVNVVLEASFDSKNDILLTN